MTGTRHFGDRGMHGVNNLGKGINLKISQIGTNFQFGRPAEKGSRVQQ